MSQAKIITLSGKTVNESNEQDVQRVRTSLYAEHGTAPFLFTTPDQHGKPIYFVRIGVTGLRDRILGPFRCKSQAILAFDYFLNRCIEVLIDAGNEGMGDSNGFVMIAPPENLTAVS